MSRVRKFWTFELPISCELKVVK